MYMNKHYPGSVRRSTALAVMIFVICLLFSECADASDLYQENLLFDSNGNLQMTTHDKKAAGGIRYRTIGWTIKRWPGNVSVKQRARIRLTQTGASYADPDDRDYVYTRFICGKEEIFERIGAASADWQLELYQTGGMVYLDAIMTVVEDGRALGWIDEDGALHGEVYTTAEGIMNARKWANPEGLRTHYNKAVYFPAIPEMIEPPGEIAQEDETVLVYGIDECGENEVKISSIPFAEPAFDVTQAIPTGEQVAVGGALQKYYYECTLRHYYGMAVVPVTLHVTYTYTYMTEDGPAKGSYTTQMTLYVQRPYSYYRIRELRLYTLEHVRVENEALPECAVEQDRLYEARVDLLRDQEQYLVIPPFSGSVYGGDVSDGACLTMEQLQQIAESVAGNVRVRNDRFGIDGEVILMDGYVEREAPDPVRQKGTRMQRFRTPELTIPHTKRNDHYQTDAWAIYRSVYDSGRRRKPVANVNDVTVHTPVTCKGGITDDRAHNQQIVPTKYLSLILGRPFTIGISTYGTHRPLPGYGSRDYDKYVGTRQIRFPFTVYIGNTAYEPGTWISLPAGNQQFYLPPGVREGDYRIRYRTIAKNAAAAQGGIDQNGYLANLELSEYGAYDELTVTVVGRMYDLAITDIVDYPRWKSVFYNRNGQKNQVAYRIGWNDPDGNQIASRVNCGIFPVLPGDHPYNPTVRAVGLGYRVRLQLRTIGDMRDSQAQIVGIPTYYYIAGDGSGRRRVRLYRRDDLTEIRPALIFPAGKRQWIGVYERNVADSMICAQSVQVWNGEYQLSADLQIVDADIDLDRYIREHGGRISQSEPVFYRDGYLLVQFELRSYPAGKAHLGYVNAANSARGYCNMWQMQGFAHVRTDRMGHRFTFADGDCLLFDIRYGLHTDYESWGTH